MGAVRLRGLAEAALARRADLIASLSADTDCYRLLSGAVEGLSLIHI